MDLMHRWALLRLLIVFVMACPFLIVPVLISLFKKHADAENCAETVPDQGARIDMSGLGTWSKRADNQSRSFHSDEAVTPAHRRAA